jgi:uncharacterized protein
MNYRTFPRIPGLQVSVLGFGCMRLPVLDGDLARIDEVAAQPLLRQAIDAGVNYVDTAYPYHGGESERFVGRALADGYRERIQLATKLPTWLVQTEADWERLLEEQLRKLDTDHIDFYLLHALNARSWSTVQRLEGLRALERAKADGRIRHIGFSFHDALSVFKEIVDGYDWEFCQVQYNFLDQAYQAGAEGVAYAASRGIGTIAMEPLRGGTLAVSQPGPVQAIWDRATTRRPPAAWALGWLWRDPAIVTAISGMNAAGQLEENLAATEAPDLTEGDLALAEEVRAFYAERMAVPCTTCGYCAPCPHGVGIPEVFAAHNTAAMFDTWKSAAWAYDTYVVGSGRGAERCLDCGDCLPKCPQEIAIPDRLREAHGALTTGR